MISAFNVASIPHISFGAGMLSKLHELVPKHGNRVLILTGGSSLEQSGKWKEITSALKQRSITFYHERVSSEPSPELIDHISGEYREKELHVIVGIGGGSVTDAGKAVSAMITKTDSIKNYLEGVGTKQHDGQKLPYIAMPTTSGTGSEATKNAVISQIGPDGFKKSLRHDNFIPDHAIIDPELMVSCPASISAACGMDAFTQLLEAYVSTNANPMTDALALSGIREMKDAIVPACGNGASNVNLRAKMAYGSLMSGITLANAGLGIIHGLASPIGGLFDIPHGVVCGTLLAEATKMNVEKLKQKKSAGKVALKKHAMIGALIEGKDHDSDIDVVKYCEVLVNTLESWSSQLNIERLGKFGITENDVETIANQAGLKNNPVPLSKEDIEGLLMRRI